ncbi:MAG: fibronectin type III domain-containing protein [Actinomycetales bacterium]|nr:fibronectin type III domain-containing protein [Actinomycetales bacterium]
MTRNRRPLARLLTLALVPAAAGLIALPAQAAASAPGVPTNVTATAAPGSATVSWTPADATADSYLVLSSPGLKSCTADAPATSCTISGLSFTKSYKFKVLAGNDTGESAWSSFSNSIVPASRPDKVAGTIGATRGDGSATVTWTLSNASNGSPITSYTATATATGAATKSCTTADGATSTCLITGLTNGTTYTVRVTATNAIGTSDPSFGSALVKPAGAAIGPASVTVTALSDTVIRATWPAASANGGDTPIYTIVVTDDLAATVLNTTQADTSRDITGLSPDRTYTVTVSANNTVGSSAAVSSTPTAPQRLAPNAPTGASATAGDTTVTVSWTASTTRGHAVISYIVTATPGGATCTANAPATTCAISSLTNGTSYSFTVVATSAGGNSAASAAATATPSGKPTPPTNVTASSISGSDTDATITKGTLTRVSWTAAGTNGSAITKYTITSTPAGGSCVVTSGTSCDIGGLTSDVAYVFTVVATNANGNSTSASSAAFTPKAAVPGKLTDVTVKRGNGTSTISVGGLEFDGGLAATYVATLTPGGKTCTITPDALGAGKCVITGLDNTVLYTTSVLAKNSKGNGPATDIDPPFDVFVSASTLVKGGAFTVYFVGALPRADVSITYGKVTTKVKASATGSGSISMTAGTVGTAEVKGSYGVVRGSAGQVTVPLVSLASKAKQGSAVNLSVTYAGKNSTVELTKVGVGVVDSKNTADATTATFTVDTATKGTVTYTVKVNGVAMPNVSIAIQ